MQLFSSGENSEETKNVDNKHDLISQKLYFLHSINIINNTKKQSKIKLVKWDSLMIMKQFTMLKEFLV